MLASFLSTKDPFKCFILLIGITFFKMTSVFGQCPDSAIFFGTQEQVDAFAVYYPDCTEINGNLEIGYFTESNASIKNLTALKNLTSIKGNLTIMRNEALTNLSGLDNIDSVGYKLTISNNTALESLAGLDNLSFVKNDFYISSNSALTNISGLNKLSSIGKSLDITNNISLADISGLEKLRLIGEELNINKNDNLADISGFNNLFSLNVDLIINENTSLADLSGFNELSYIDGVFSVSYNPNLSNISGLGNLDLITGKFDIIENSGLADITGLNNLSSIRGNFNIENTGLVDLTGLNELSSILGDFSIYGNSNLTNLSGLSNLSSIGNNLYIYRNSSLINLMGLDNLNSVGGDLYFTENSALASLSGLNKLNSIGGKLHIENNDALINLSGLDNLSSLNGHLLISSNALLTNLSGLENVTSIKKYLDISYNTALTDLTGLNNLTSIEGRLNIKYNYALNNLVGLNMLSSIRGFLNVEYNSTLANLSGLENLGSIGGGFNISNNANLVNLSGLEKLCSIGGNINITNNPILDNVLGFKKLSLMVGDVTISNNSTLATLSGLEAVTSISGYLTINDNNALTDLSDLHSLLEVGGLVIKGNCNLFEYLPNLENIHTLSKDLVIINTGFPDLSGLENITSVHSLIIRSNGLTNLKGLENLKEIHGDFLIVENNAQINFSGLEGLVLVGGNFKIGGGIEEEYYGGNSAGGGYYITYPFEGSDALASLQGLENLQTIGGDFQIAHLPRLTSLTSLENLNTIGGKFDLFYNPLLNTCNIPFTCTFLSSSDNYTVGSNAQGCNTVSEILENCENLAKIKSQFFYDVNQNKMQDEDEPFVSFVAVNINPGELSVHPNLSTGSGIQYVEPGNYTLSLKEESYANWLLTTDSTGYNFNLEEGDCETSIFGFYPKQLISEMQSTINSPNTRCNDTIPFTISSNNSGTSITEGILWFKVDSSITTTKFIDQPDTIIQPNQYGWFFNNLPPSHLVSQQIKLAIPGVDVFELGDSLTFQSFTEFADENGEQQSKIFTYQTLVRCAFDPNDKLVNPNRLCNHILMDENITYTIRFQNTGNDVAYKVLISDEIDSNLDLNTFSLINSSHIDSLQTSISDNGTVTFEFNNINLPDSTTNLEGSNGYVMYSIKPKTGLPENTVIKNTSAIYFDFNPAIITNTVENVLVSELPNITWCRDVNNNGLGNPNESIESCVQPEGYVMDCSDANDLVSIEEEGIRNLITIYPNPSNGVFRIDVDGLNFKKALLSLYNANGQLIIEPTALQQNQQWLKYPDLDNGIYYLMVRLDDKVLRRKLVLVK